MASKRTTKTVTVSRVTRGNSSANGNPSFIFHTDSGQYRTQTDSGMAYGLENDWEVNTGRWREFNTQGCRAWHDGPALAELTLMPSGRVESYSGMRAAE